MRALMALTVLLCACSSLRSGANEVALTVDRPSVAAGDSIVLTLANGTGASVGYNLCTTGLERQSGSGWETIPSDRVCTMELRTLEPGGSARYTSELPRVLPPGDYRVFTTIELMGDGTRTDVRSGTFRVTS